MERNDPLFFEVNMPEKTKNKRLHNPAADLITSDSDELVHDDQDQLVNDNSDQLVDDDDALFNSDS